jgi:hypothetical protein
MQPYANTALSYIYAAYGKSGLISNGKEYLKIKILRYLNIHGYDE